MTVMSGKTLQRQVADHNTSIHLQDSSCQMGKQEQLDVIIDTSKFLKFVLLNRPEYVFGLFTM